MSEVIVIKEENTCNSAVSFSTSPSYLLSVSLSQYGWSQLPWTWTMVPKSLSLEGLASTLTYFLH